VVRASKGRDGATHAATDTGDLACGTSRTGTPPPRRAPHAHVGSRRPRQGSGPRVAVGKHALSSMSGGTKTVELRVSSFRTSEWRVAGHRNGLTGSVFGFRRRAWSLPLSPLKGWPGGGGPAVRGLPGLDQPAAGPLPGRGRGGVRAAVPAAEDLSERDQSWHRGADHPAAQGAGRAGPGRRAAHHRLAPGPPSSGHGVGGHRQPLPHPGRAGHPATREAADVVLLALPGRPAERVLAVGLHPLPAGRRRGHRDLDLAG
jgi:hypothetical protein